MTGFVALIILAGIMAVERPAVQTRLTGKILSLLESSFGGNIQVGSIAIKPLSSFVLKDVSIIDNEPWPDTYNKGYARADTVMYFGKVSGTFSIWGLIQKKGIIVPRLNVDDALLHIVAEPGEKWPSNLNRVLRSPLPPENPEEKPDLFEIKKVRINNFRFRLTNLLPVRLQYRGVGFNWENLDIRVGKAAAHNIHFTGGRMSFVVDDLNMEDRCGYKASSIKGKAICGMGKVFVEGFSLVDQWSVLNVPTFSMTFDNAYSFKDYVNKVRMDVIVLDSELSGKTLSYFIDALPDDTALADIDEIRFSGTVNDFTVKSAKFTEKGSGTTMNLSAHVRNVTNLPESILNAKLHNIGFTTSGVSALVNSITGTHTLDLGNLGKGSRFNLSGTADGPISDFIADISVRPATGMLSARMNVKNILVKSECPEISGTAFSRDFDLGDILGNDVLGPVSMTTGLSARLEPGRISANIDSLKVSRLNALGYDYSGIEAAGTMTGKSFDGKIICDDPNLNFLFQGICNISSRTQNALYHFYANLGYADLKALNLDKRAGVSRASCRVSADFLRIVKGDGIGDIKINDIILEDSNGIHDIGNATIDSRNGADGYRVLFKSSFADGIYKGTGSPALFFGDLQAVTTRKHLPALYPSTAAELPDSIGAYSLAFNFHDSRDLLSFVKPGLYIADSTSIKLQLNNDSSMSGVISSPRLAMGRNYLKGSRIHIDNKGNQLNAIVSNDEVKLAGIVLKESGITAHASHNNASLGLNFQGEDPERDHGEIFVNGRFTRNASDSLAMIIQPLKSYIIQNGNKWDIAQSEIKINGGRLGVDDFRITNGGQMLHINGGLSPGTADTLRLDVRNFGMELANGFTAQDFDIGGRANGFAEVISPSASGMQVAVDMLCDYLNIGNENVGEVRLKGSWDKQNNRLNIDIKGDKDGRRPLEVKGFIAPQDKALDINASLDSLNLAICTPFLSGIFSEMNGSASGSVRASGNFENPQISSTGLTLEGAKVRLDATGVAYTLHGPVSVANDGLTFEGIEVRDEKAGRGNIHGRLLYNGPEEIVLDTRVTMRNLQAIDIPEKDSKGLYGNLSANGDVRVSGPLDSLVVSGNVSTAGEGQVHVPLNTAVASTGNDLLTFTEKEKFVYIDPYEQMMSESPSDKKSSKGNVLLHLRAGATPDVKAVIELNKATGNVITASGTASVMLDMETAGNKINLAGDYILNGGNLHFELPGIVKKEFSIKDGSAIRFNGDVMNSEVDLTAIYNLKTSLSTLLSDTTSVSTRRPVECSIRITDKITNPQVAFGVDVPDLDPNSRTKMAEALNTEDKVQKQFIALLVMGTFLPNEQSGVVNGTNILYSNVGELMSNQLNNILQKLNIPLDLGLGYQQSQGGTNIFDVAISTQLFNNRVEIGGTVGNRQYRTSKNPNGDVVGDIDISIKLDKPGQFKLNLFSHSADEYTSFLDYSQRNGIGVAYSKEYDHFWQMLKEIFTSRKKRERQAAEREAARERSERAGERTDRTGERGRNRKTITITE